MIQTHMPSRAPMLFFLWGGRKKNVAELKTLGGLNQRAFDPGQYLLFRVTWNEGGNFETWPMLCKQHTFHSVTLFEDLDSDSDESIWLVIDSLRRWSLKREQSNDTKSQRVSWSVQSKPEVFSQGANVSLSPSGSGLRYRHKPRLLSQRWFLSS